MRAKQLLVSAVLLTVWMTNVTGGVMNGTSLRAECEKSESCRATSRHYARLVSGAAPAGAELALFANMLPKGGDLHHHYTGAIYAETFLEWVKAQNYCIYTENVKVGDQSKQKYHIETKPEVLPVELRPLCISADEVMKRKDNEKSFYRGLLMRWSDKDYDNHSHEQNPPDQQFFEAFGYFGPVAGYSFRDGLKALKERAITENLQYLETQLKGAPTVDNKELAPGLNALSADSPDDKVDAALTAYADFMDRDSSSQGKIKDYVKLHQDAAAGLDDARFKVRFQSYIARNAAPAVVFSGLYSAYVAARTAPDLIVGVNIVSQENGEVSMRDYGLHMKMFRFLNKRFPGVKLSLHAGELVLGMVPPEGLRSHIREAVEVAGARRIGHGVDIAHEADALGLLDKMREEAVAIEINLTSNAFILGVKAEDHPVQLYRKYKVPFVISTDDAGISRNNLSGEYALFMSRYKPGYAELKETVYNSIRYSFLSEREKTSELRGLQKRFAEFEKRVAENIRMANVH